MTDAIILQAVVAFAITAPTHGLLKYALLLFSGCDR